MKDMKVLIVDDHQEIRALMRECLPVWANEVVECADGLEALAAFREHRPDWVLMDWEMPRQNGIEAARQIIAEFPDARICMVTAFDDEEVRREALAVGARGFVLKEDLTDLPTVIRR